MSYSGEQTLLVTRPTRLIALRWWSAVVLALIVAGALFLQFPWRFSSTLANPALGSLPVSAILAAFFLFLALVAFIIAELKRKTTRYVITDNKIIREDGILNKNTEMIPYTQLERVDMKQSFGQRILRIGTIVVDTGDDTMNLDMIPRPAQVQELLSSRLGRRGWSGQQPSGQQQPPATR
ncbi:MAG: PH domain-containing protein [Methanobacteriota archaeon]|nr:MAG: PH domain-containing protein [Euryarchaeota archaeon]